MYQSGIAFDWSHIKSEFCVFEDGNPSTATSLTSLMQRLRHIFSSAGDVLFDSHSSPVHFMFNLFPPAMNNSCHYWSLQPLWARCNIQRAPLCDLEPSSSRPAASTSWAVAWPQGRRGTQNGGMTAEWGKECVLIWLRINSRFACTRWKFKTGICRFFAAAVSWSLTGLSSAGWNRSWVGFLQKAFTGSSVIVGLHLACVCVRAWLCKVLWSCCVCELESSVLIVLETQTFLTVMVWLFFVSMWPWEVRHVWNSVAPPLLLRATARGARAEIALRHFHIQWFSYFFFRQGLRVVSNPLPHRNWIRSGRVKKRRLSQPRLVPRQHLPDRPTQTNL